MRLDEDFSDDITCLETFDNAAAHGRVEAGAYLLELHAPEEILHANCESLVIGNFDFEVDIRLLEIPQAGAYYFGVLLRVSGSERYAFVIGSEGGYCVYYASDSIFIPLTNSTDFDIDCWVSLPEEAMRAGNQHIRVVAFEDRIDLYLNDVLLAVVRDSQLSEGWLGFIVATSEEGGILAEYDNLRVTRP